MVQMIAVRVTYKGEEEEGRSAATLPRQVAWQGAADGLMGAPPPSPPPSLGRAAALIGEQNSVGGTQEVVEQLS